MLWTSETLRPSKISKGCFEHIKLYLTYGYAALQQMLVD